MDDKLKIIAIELLGLVEDKSLIDQCKDEIKTFIKEFAISGETLLESMYSIYLNKTSVGGENKINSWLAYGIGLTSKKPDGDFLPKRRIFARAGFPDIDVDFEYERRGEVYDYIIDKYGRDNVGNIGTYNSLKFRSFITRAVKALDLAKSFNKSKDEYVKNNNALVRRIIDSLPDQKGAFLKVKDDSGEQVIVKGFMDAYRYCKEFRRHIDQYPDLIEYAGTIEGLLSSYGVHAAGIVVSDIPLANIAPLRLAKTKKDGTRDLATQYDNEDLEYLGLIKFDILALSTLSVISMTLDYIKKFEDIDIDIENLSLDDDKAFELYRSGKLTGVFQCEERGMQKTMQEIRVDRFDDIVAGIALFRPGPMASIPKYCARKHGQEHVDYYHPDIEPFVKPYLEKTYGILVFQEQVMQICNSLAGLTVTDGYVIIKAVGKKNEDLLRRYRLKFIDGCVSNGVGKRIATEYWDKFITPFAAYGFNKSHSESYSVLSYQTAYLKSHYPELFMMAYLNVECRNKKYEKVEHLEKEVTRMGIEIEKRHINKCELEYELVRTDLPNGISISKISPSIMCKGLSTAAAKSIVKNKPYKSLEDFAIRTDLRHVDSEAFNSLMSAGIINNDADSLDKFNHFRSHLKKVRKKGYQGIDIFG
jgi:DNA polymerase-3 subunit alpha